MSIRVPARAGQVAKRNHAGSAALRFATPASVDDRAEPSARAPVACALNMRRADAPRRRRPRSSRRLPPPGYGKDDRPTPPTATADGRRARPMPRSTRRRRRPATTRSGSTATATASSVWLTGTSSQLGRRRRRPARSRSRSASTARGPASYTFAAGHASVQVHRRRQRLDPRSDEPEHRRRRHGAHEQRLHLRAVAHGRRHDRRRGGRSARVHSRMRAASSRSLGASPAVVRSADRRSGARRRRSRSTTDVRSGTGIGSEPGRRVRSGDRRSVVVEIDYETRRGAVHRNRSIGFGDTFEPTLREHRSRVRRQEACSTIPTSRRDGGRRRDPRRGAHGRRHPRRSRPRIATVTTPPTLQPYYMVFVSGHFADQSGVQPERARRLVSATRSRCSRT